MSESESEPTPQQRVRRIEEETDRLAEHIEQARDAVHRAGRADSMAEPGAEGSWKGVVGGEAERIRPDESAEGEREQAQDERDEK